MIISDNAACFTATFLVNFSDDYGIKWKTVLAYAPMTDGRVERLVGTIKRAISNTVIDDATN